VDVLEPLNPMMLAVFNAVRGVEEVQYPIELAHPVWDYSLPELVEVLTRMGPALHAELAREKLSGERDDSLATASWATWSFDHPNYRRAVQHGVSTMRERDNDLIGLVVRHESTHVLSMLGGLGVAMMALRAATVELELDLWALYQHDSGEEFIHRGVATLGEPTPLAAVVAERQLELLEKIQILPRHLESLA
jgi:hypothetical protein